MQKKEQKEIHYRCNCVICGNPTITIKNTANEGICYNCRVVG